MVDMARTTSGLTRTTSGFDRVASSMSLSSEGREAQVKEEIVLDRELLNSDHWRHQGRRRLEVIQASCKANLRFDKLRGVVHVSGSEADVEMAKDQLANLGGPRKSVKTPVWVELLRAHDGPQEGAQATIAKIQQESKCRIHIERSSEQVRLVGHSKDIMVAEKLLEELHENCVEEKHYMSSSDIDPPALRALENSCGVTLRQKYDHVVVLGMQHAVKKAIRDLEHYVTDPEFRASFPEQKNTKVEDEVEDSSKATSPSARNGRLQSILQFIRLVKDQTGLSPA